MTEEPLKILSDRASEAHAQIQQAHEHINPVICVRRGLRDTGIPADVMTIDCLKSRKRILFILHDNESGVLLYRFETLDEEGAEFQRINLADVSASILYEWMQYYFSHGEPGL